MARIFIIFNTTFIILVLNNLYKVCVIFLGFTLELTFEVKFITANIAPIFIDITFCVHLVDPPSLPILVLHKRTRQKRSTCTLLLRIFMTSSL